jgi:hypothetical protein
LRSIATSSITASPDPSVKYTDDRGARHDAHLAAALLEAAHVDEPGRDDLAGLDRGDPPDRQEDVAAPGISTTAHHTRRVVFSVDDDDVTDFAEPVARGVEDGAAHQACHENPLRTHPSSVVCRLRVKMDG